MKKCIVAAMGVFLSVVLCGYVAHLSAADWRTPMPNDVKIEPPAPGLPENVAALSGAWQGEWDYGGGASQSVTIVIETISPKEVGAVYSSIAWARDSEPSGWRRVKGIVQGDKVILTWNTGEQFSPQNHRVTLTLQKENAVFGEYLRGVTFARGYFDRVQ
jgi:hypothetical protein